MLWRKDYCSMVYDPNYREFRKKYKHSGVAVYELLLKLCYGQINFNDPVFCERIFENKKIIFVFDESVLKDHLLISRQKLIKIAHGLNEFSLLNLKIIKKQYQIEIPNLLKSLDETSRKSAKKLDLFRNDSGADKIRRDKIRLDKNQVCSENGTSLVATTEDINTNKTSNLNTSSSNNSKSIGWNKSNKIHTGIYIQEIRNLAEQYYPTSDGLTEGVELLSQDIGGDLQKLQKLKKSIKNYAKAVENRDPQFIKSLKSFAIGWRDWVNPKTSSKRAVVDL